MKKVVLKQLKLQNFKGIKELTLDLDGENAQVFGDNATGKTTVVDAFIWLLFNKDSQNKIDFGIKTLKGGNVINRLNHEVEAVLEVDEQDLTLKKVFSEKWTKKRGSAKESFTGHTTDYFIDGVPAKKKEFDEMIKSMINEDVFKLLTNPTFFNEEIGWKERRDLLIEIAGDITDEDVIKSNKDLKVLLSKLNGKSIEDNKKIIAAKRKDINKQIEQIPTRIDEIHRNLPDTSKLKESEINKSIAALDIELEKIQKKVNDIQNGSEINKLKKELSDKELSLRELKNKHEEESGKGVYALKSKLQENQSNRQNFATELRGLQTRKKLLESDIQGIEAKMKGKREEYKEVSSESFKQEENTLCPTCSQSLPEDQVEGLISKFNVEKSEKLTHINKVGKDMKNDVESTKKELESIDKEIEKVTENGKNAAKEIAKIESKLEELEGKVVSIEENKEYQKLMSEITAIDFKLTDIQENSEEEIAKLKEEKKTIQEQRIEEASKLQDLAYVKRSEVRVSELEAEEQALATEFEELEHQLYLSEEFTRTKVEMLTENINKKFKYARFNLFKENINGGLEEICETTFEGVPYSAGLNNAARINVGLDIIQTLSKHYKVEAPIFIDNAESVTELIDMDAQVISLIVSKTDKKLRVETKKTEGVA